jgi:chemotaxis protein methyltransferase CheR
MKDNECVEFLLWALPHMRMRWPGFRKVRKQVCKRIAVRLKELSLAGPSEYKTYLADHPEEWKDLDSFCRITISRFYRDKSVFHYLQDTILQELAKKTGATRLRCWCCGCAGGEEPYTLSLIWHQTLKPRFPETDIEIIATDSMDMMLDRALTASYTKSSLKDLPEDLLRTCFTLEDKLYSLKELYRAPVQFLKQDIREEMPEGPFQIILCRYMVFTYFDEKLQTELLEKFLARLAPGGALVLGGTDRLPRRTDKLMPWSERDKIYRKV